MKEYLGFVGVSWLWGIFFWIRGRGRVRGVFVGINIGLNNLNIIF